MPTVAFLLDPLDADQFTPLASTNEISFDRPVVVPGKGVVPVGRSILVPTGQSINLLENDDSSLPATSKGYAVLVRQTFTNNVFGGKYPAAALPRIVSLSSTCPRQAGAAGIAPLSLQPDIIPVPPVQINGQSVIDAAQTAVTTANAANANATAATGTATTAATNAAAALATINTLAGGSQNHLNASGAVAMDPTITTHIFTLTGNATATFTSGGFDGESVVIYAQCNGFTLTIKDATSSLVGAVTGASGYQSLGMTYFLLSWHTVSSAVNAGTNVTVIPPSPTWQGATLSYTIPVFPGVVYNLVGTGGALTPLTPGSHTVAAGAAIDITATPKQGYAFPGVFTWHHAFVDPSTVTIATSDTFSGFVENAVLSSRTTDAALGGAPMPWVITDLPVRSTDSGMIRLHSPGLITISDTPVAGQPALDASGAASGKTGVLLGPALGQQVEFDITAANGANGAGMFSVQMFSGNGHYLYSGIGFGFNIGNIYLSSSVIPMPAAVGHWKLSVFGGTATVNSPDGQAYYVDISNMTFSVQPGVIPTWGSGNYCGFSSAYDFKGSASIKNIVFSRIGALS